VADEAPIPRLRAVEAFPVRLDGQELICLRDPGCVAESALSVSRAAGIILALLDGTRSLADLQAEIMRRHGVLVYREELAGLIDTLDRHLFLESPRFDAERARLAEAFRRSPVRPAAHAGHAYEAEPAALGARLASFFEHPEGPGRPAARRATRLAGLVAPHIDFQRGGPAYAWAYGALAEAAEADCFIVFGTAHAGLDDQTFAATRKPYATPFGTVDVDLEVLEAIAQRAPGDLFAAELAHRTEHSVEFQAVCLAFLHRDRPIRIVPVLTSFAHECLARGVDPMQEPRIAAVLDAVRDAMTTVSRGYCLIAGADLAHVGPRFGDPQPVSPIELGRIDAEDRALLARVAGGDRDGFFATVARDGDRRRICGLSPIYTLLATLPGGRGRLLHYGQWPDPQGTVTFASVAFEEDL
jgi:AmmeMemoRadiSam system protein B